MNDLYAKNAAIDLFNPGCEASKLLSFLQVRDGCEGDWFTLTYKGIKTEKLKTAFGTQEYAKQMWVFTIDPMLMLGWDRVGPGDNEISYLQGTGWTTPPTLTDLFEALKCDASYLEEAHGMTMVDLGLEGKTLDEIDRFFSDLRKAQYITMNWARLRKNLRSRQMKPIAWSHEKGRMARQREET